VDPAILRKRYPALLDQFSDEEVVNALQVLLGEDQSQETTGYPGDDRETVFRRDEFTALRSGRNEGQLLSTPIELTAYSDGFAEYFGNVVLVKKLRETRALTGFTRVFPENSESPESRKALLRRSSVVPPNRWLAAYMVHGEGIFMELNDRLLKVWENRVDVKGRAERLAGYYRTLQERRGLRSRSITPRFLLLHTLAHLLINELTFECGYSTASLRERLYHSASREGPMAGLLIYTAAGDAEGTLGGLVRMGKPGVLEVVIRRAVQKAQWCSSDPVCMEIGEMGGQGPDSCNLAACHNCALVPETSCEEFNRFLDRGFIVGSVDNPSLGFFGHFALPLTLERR